MYGMCSLSLVAMGPQSVTVGLFCEMAWHLYVTCVYPLWALRCPTLPTPTVHCKCHVSGGSIASSGGQPQGAVCVCSVRSRGPWLRGLEQTPKLELAVWPQVTLAPSTLASSSSVHRHATVSASHAFLPVGGCEPHACGGPGGHVSLSVGLTFEFNGRCPAVHTVICHKVTGMLASTRTCAVP